MKSCEMHLVLVLSDHVNVGKDPLYRPPKTQKAEEGRTTQTTVFHMLRHQENSPVKILGRKRRIFTLSKKHF